jgi:hypothetical protein
MLSVPMVNVTNNPFILSVIILNVVTLNVVAPAQIVMLLKRQFIARKKVFLVAAKSDMTESLVLHSLH